MKIYLDDDSANPLVVKLLSREGQAVIPADVGNAGEHDAAHFMFAIQHQRLLLTHNHDDFKLLHELVLVAGGHHPGVLTVRRDNDPTRDLTPKGIVRALRNLIKAGVPVPDKLYVLNHWR